MKKREINKTNGFLIIILAFSVFLGGRIDNDVYFLLNCGRYLETHGFPRTEPFTIHEGLQYQMQQWLTDSLFWKLFQQGGYAALLVLISILFALHVYLFYRLSLLVSEGNQKLALVMAIMAAILTSGYKTTRPMLITIVFLELFLLCLETYTRSRRYQWLFALPVLSVLCVNFHAAMWPMMPVFLLPYWLDAAMRGKIPALKWQNYRRMPLFLASAAVIAGGLLNPYGWQGPTYTFRSYHTELQVIQEMCPPDIRTGTGMLIFGGILVLFLVIVFYQKGKTRLRYILLVLGTGYMALSSIRNWFFLVLTAGVFLSYWLKDSHFFRKEWKEDPDAAKKMAMNMAAVFLIIAVSVIGEIGDHFGLKHTEEPLYGVAEYMKENCDPNTTVLYNEFNEGGYLEFLGYRTYVDPRAEVFLKGLNGKEDIFTEYLLMTAGKIHYNEVFEKYKFTHLLITKGAENMLETYLPYEKKWKKVYEDENYMLYARNE